MCGVQQALKGSLGRGIFAYGLGALANLAEQLEGWAEEVMKEAPGAVEVVEERDQLRQLQALIAQKLAHVGPVLLLDMGLVVFAIGAAARHRDRPRSIQQV